MNTTQHNNHSRALILVAIAFVLMPELALSADLNSMVSKIFNWVQTALTAIGTLIIVAVGIYFLKNLERWKEIFIQCVGIIAATLLIMNAQAISQWAFN
ncbi:TrbC/VirB2 family protein [Helicobacter japonicus]|uniref:TrbC/VirB2 family protein n=1 Tax=Helicobacter japonicus TaxID=425400 RepID=UPI0023F50703|nr:TrbC/VirB2 family protein [Helicobacter japonicus]